MLSEFHYTLPRVHPPTCLPKAPTFSVALLGDTIRAIHLVRAVERSQALRRPENMPACLSRPERNAIVVGFIRARCVYLFLSVTFQ